MSHISVINKFSKSGVPVVDLSRFKALCNELEIDADVLSKKIKFIHLAGTNGKGSVCEYIADTLSKSGYMTGKFTSPYILKINERIQINNVPISDNDLSAYAETVCQAVGYAEKMNISGFSQFEILTAIAFLYFSDKKCDYAVIEAGIGGLLDCTNVITPQISVITAIDFDHSEILGNTLKEITAHKAGIIKQGKPCILYPEQAEDVTGIIKQKAEEKNSTLTTPALSEIKIKSCSVRGNVFEYKGEDYSTKMGGRHQVLNAVTAIETLNIPGLDKGLIKSSIANSQLPARMQVIGESPLVIADGAHNPHGLRACRILSEELKTDGGKKVLLIGMMKGKDCRASLSEILSRTEEDKEVFYDKVVFCDGFSENAVKCPEMYKAAAGLTKKPVYAVPNCMEALSLAKKLASAKGVVLVTGSLYLAGYVLNKCLMAVEK